MSNRVWLGVCTDGHLHRLYDDVVLNAPDTLKNYLIHNHYNARVLDTEPLMPRTSSPNVLSHDYLVVAVMDNRCPDRAYPSKVQHDPLPPLTDAAGKIVPPSLPRPATTSPAVNQPLGFSMESLLAKLDQRIDKKFQQLNKLTSTGVTPSSTPSPIPQPTPLSTTKDLIAKPRLSHLTSYLVDTTRERVPSSNIKPTKVKTASEVQLDKKRKLQEAKEKLAPRMIIIPPTIDKATQSVPPVVPKPNLKKTVPIIMMKTKPKVVPKTVATAKTPSAPILPILPSSGSSTAAPPVESRNITVDDLVEAMGEIRPKVVADSLQENTM